MQHQGTAKKTKAARQAKMHRQLHTSVRHTSALATGVPQIGAHHTSASQTGAPHTSAPATGLPQIGAHHTGAPHTSAPATGVPQTGAHHASVHHTSVPATGVPQTGAHHASVRHVSVPQTGARHASVHRTGADFAKVWSLSASFTAGSCGNTEGSTLGKPQRNALGSTWESLASYGSFAVAVGAVLVTAFKKLCKALPFTKPKKATKKNELSRRSLFASHALPAMFWRSGVA